MLVKKAGTRCTVAAGVPAGYSIHPKVLHTTAHHWSKAVVTIRPDAVASDIAVVFETRDGVRGQVRINAAVASQLVISGRTGHASACVSAAKPKADPAGFPIGWPVAGGGLLALIAASVAVVVSRRRRGLRPQRGGL